MDILHHHDPEGGSFHLDEDGRSLAEMSYVLEPDRLVIEHTQVDQDVAGHGLGHSLLEEAARYARAQGLKLGATCPFARTILEKDQAFEDVAVH